jgi:hypothetical protein
LTKLIRQYYQYGYWKVFVNTKHQTITSFRQVVPALLVLLAATGILGLFSSGFLLLYLTGMLSYLLAALVSAFRVASNSNEFFVSLIVFPSLHFSYGIGYLEGVWDFVLFKKVIKDSKTAMTR